MRRDEVITSLKAHEADIRALGVAALYLYGSHARDEASDTSDVDVFIDRDVSYKIGLLELARLQALLENALGIDVDVGTRTSLHPALKTTIELNAVRVF